ncbi:MAG: hypothetical protein QXO16_01055 [Archaeoglobaceae archaeon]
MTQPLAKDVETEFLRFKRAVEKFNTYHSPEANAEILGIEGDKVFVKMTGVFCISCGVFDYFEDIAIEADAEILSYEEVEDGFLLEYRLRRR